MTTNPQDGAVRPTVVLMHGAFAESASWDGVIGRLHAEGYTAVAVANPLRSLSGDAGSVAGVLGSIEGPVVLVGHSYGGSVISGAALGNEDVLRREPTPTAPPQPVRATARPVKGGAHGHSPAARRTSSPRRTF